MNKYSLKSFALLWMFILIFSFLGFLYLVLNLFFSEHITKSSLKDLKYTAYVAKLNLSEEQKEMENTLARHVSSVEFQKVLFNGKFGDVNSFVENWKTLSKIDNIAFYNSDGVLVDLSSGEESTDGARLANASLNQLDLGYGKTVYFAGPKKLSISVQRRILDKNFQNQGYLVETKNIPYQFFLAGESDRDIIVMTPKMGIVFASKSLKSVQKYKDSLLSTSSEAFELAVDGKTFDVVKLELAQGITFFLVKKNLREVVFKKFYKKYLAYFILFLLFLMMIFYLSYYRQVFRPLQKISAFIESEDVTSSAEVETSVYEISLIAQKLESKISKLSENAEQSKKGRVEDMARLVASVAHELNNSLSYLGGNLTYLKEELSSSEDIDFKDCRDAIISAESGYERIKKIVSDLKVFSAAGKMELSWVRACDFRDRLSGEFQGVAFSLPAENEELEFKVDVDRTYQIIRNLVLNAVQAYPEESGDKKVLVSFFQENDEFIIAVKDWAGGISGDVKSKIFEPFFTTKKNIGGAGLGLSLSRNLAHEMDAALYIRETNSEGTVFCFTTRQFKLKV